MESNIQKTRFTMELWPRKRITCINLKWSARVGRVTGCGLWNRKWNECSTLTIDPGMDVRLENTQYERVCYRTNTSAQLPWATQPGVSHRADSRQVRLFEGEQLITSVIARAPTFVIKCGTGKLPMLARRPGSVVVTVCGLPA